MMKKIRLLLTFYRGFGFVALFFSCISASILFEKGFSAFNIVFWFKIITTTIIVYNVSTNRRNEFFYYQNLGLSKTILWSVTLSFDFIIFILTTIIISFYQ